LILKIFGNSDPIFQRLLPTFYNPARREQDYDYNMYLSLIHEKDTQTERSYLQDIFLPAGDYRGTSHGNSKECQTQHELSQNCTACYSLIKECTNLKELLHKREKLDQNDYINELEETIIEIHTQMSALRMLSRPG
jgi:hypothetical protein